MNSNATTRDSGRTRAVQAAATIAAGAALVATLGYVHAADDPGGYVGKGQLVVQTALAGADTKLTVGGEIALEQRGALLRLDILSLAIPGAGAAISSLLATQLFPAGGFTVVYDRKAATYTIWSSAKQKYYTTAGGAAPAPQTPPTRAVASNAANELFGPLAFAKAIKDDSAFSATLSLAGHGPINGHPATGLDYQYARTTKTGEKTDIHGRLQLADDLDAIPVQVTASVKSKNIPESSLKLDLTSLAKQTPNESDFEVPKGYARAADLGDVIGKTLPR
ncbi:MAG: hypothetical protein NVS3B16_15410 [Vulcanimicrobiaceae bacterium]